MKAPIDVTGLDKVTLDKHEILCREGDEDTDLYLVLSGRLLACVVNGTQVSPLAYIGPGEFIGELSFFDGEPRSANIISVDKTELAKIPSDILKKELPIWLDIVGKSMAHRIRRTDEVIRKSGMKRQNVESTKPLTIEEQRLFYRAIQLGKA